jgi:hypothetical protein
LTFTEKNKTEESTVGVLSKRLLPSIFGIAAVGWVIGGTFWYKQRFCEPQQLAAAAVVSVTHRTTTEGQMPLCFPQGGSKVLLTLDNLETLKLTAHYLSMNTDKLLVINGLQSQKEFLTPPSVSEPILALERAESLKSSLVNLGAPSHSMKTKGEIVLDLPTNRGYIYDAVKFELINNPLGRFQALNIFYRQGGFQFADNQELTNYFTALFHFLDKNPKAKIFVTAHRSNTEGGQLDERRLSFFRKYLENHDFNTRQFQFINQDSKKPMSQNDDSKNQRIEIRIQIV